MENTGDKNLTKEQRREEQRRARERAERNEKTKRVLKKVLVWLIVIVLVVLAIRWLINQFPRGADYSKSFPIQGQDHIAIGALHPPYNSNPPTSGWHYAAPANVGFYDRELPDERLVHNLEHGHIWIAYRPTIPDEIKSQLKKLAGGMAIVTPRPTNDTDLALVAWGRLDAFNLDGTPLDSQRIQSFILRYQNKGPEKVGMPRI